jgi:hypothetical protein
MHGIRKVSEDIRSRLLQREFCRRPHNLWGRTAELRGFVGTADGVKSESTDRRSYCLVEIRLLEQVLIGS